VKSPRMHTNGRISRRPRAAGVHTTALARREPRMHSLTAALLAAPLICPMTAAAWRRARRGYRRWAR
jgi:hypothetical protein